MIADEAKTYFSETDHFDGEPCPGCHEKLEPEMRGCAKCGLSFQPHYVGYYWSEEPLAMLNLYIEDLDIDSKAGEILDEDGFDDEEFQELIEQAENELLTMIDENHGWEKLAKFILLSAGIDYRLYESEPTLECEVCEGIFRESATQEHHISYVHDFTITACYSCHRRIHHEDGYYDDLQPKISRKEAERLKETGYPNNG